MYYGGIKTAESHDSATFVWFLFHSIGNCFRTLSNDTSFLLYYLNALSYIIGIGT